MLSSWRCLAAIFWHNPRPSHDDKSICEKSQMASSGWITSENVEYLIHTRWQLQNQAMYFDQWPVTTTRIPSFCNPWRAILSNYYDLMVFPVTISTAGFRIGHPHRISIRTIRLLREAFKNYLADIADYDDGDVLDRFTTDCWQLDATLVTAWHHFEAE